MFEFGFPQVPLDFGDGFSGNRAIFENQSDIITVKTLQDLDKLTISQPQTLF